MDKKAIWKWMLLTVAVAGALWTVLPMQEKVRLGLDLKGGTSFTVEIDEAGIQDQLREEFKDLSDSQRQEKVPARIRDAQARGLEVIRNRVDGMGIAEPVIYPEKDNRIVVQLPGIGEKKRAEAASAIQSAAFLEFRMVHEKNNELVEKLFDKGAQPEGFKLVSASGKRGGERSYYKRDKNAPPLDQEARRKLATFNAPHGYEFLLEKEKINGEDLYSPYFVEKRPQLTGETLKHAAVDYRTMGDVAVSIEFNAKGARKFAMVTSDFAPGGARNPNPQVGRQMAIVLDGTLYSAPVIREPIHGGRAEISGSFTVSEAALLANILRSGSLPAPVKIVEQRIVDPTLGADSIHSGIMAGVFGCAVIMLLMAMYYLINGLLADVALMLNVVLLPLGMVVVAGVLGLFAKDARAGGPIALPVLTLPGIAGIALSIGMAVDTNVLIFERIREELRGGKGLKAAIDAGFSRAFAAVFDSHVATILTATIMFIFGSGPIRGYAVTLIAGLLVNLYTAVTVTHMCHMLIAARTSNTGVLRMFSVIPQTRIDFISLWPWWLGGTFVVVLAAWGIMITHGLQDRTKVFAVDFTGGTALTMSFEQKPGVDKIREALSGVGVKESVIQYQVGMQSGSQSLLQVKVGTVQEGALAGKTLVEKFPEAKFKVMQQDDVGPQVGKELEKRAMWAMIWGMVAMVVYIAFRFELGFGIGAIVATFHDAMITIGVMHLLGFQLNMTVMAAVLTIIGYSVNDTIVIFDRIRENLRMSRGQSFKDLCNLSINQTLARTLLTNFYTLISVLFLLLMGGGALRDFSVAMLVGMITGTYSSVYIATPVTLVWYRWKSPDLGSKSVA